ncbi:DUF7341 domain-containing protein [Demequina gelatinilytica]|uniref:DUF7341 domain-containing protein n=1 Tax=Demequina gelatinilytica TaxID=1638980 RepID=UPI00078281AE|nr:hypothetical protein [Demequina gelatinilytica]
MPTPQPTTDTPPLTAQERRRLQADLAHQLRPMIEPFTSHEPWYRWDDTDHRWENMPAGLHTTELPSLLEQLQHATKQANGSTSGGYQSTVLAHTDAIDGQRSIDHDVTAFVSGKLHTQPGPLEANLALIIRRIPTLVDADLLELAALAKRWVIAAKVLSGLDARPWAPHNRCPWCSAMDSLRIRFDVSGQLGVGWCKECKETWDENQIWMLGAEIKKQNAEGVDEDDADGEDDDAVEDDA